MENQGKPKTRVLVIGAGPAGLTAAEGLSRTPELRERFDITVLEVSWRAGGKCTSGREGELNRIELNGTHYLFGCYDAMFKLMRQAYQELNAAGDFKSGTFEEQLLPRNRVVFEQFFQGNWTRWNIELPINGEKPGVDAGLLSPAEYVVEILQWILEAFLGWKALAALEEAAAGLLAAENGLERVLRRIERELVRVLGGTSARVGEAHLRSALDAAKTAGAHPGAIRTALRDFRQWLWALLRDRIETNLELLRIWIVLDLGVTSLIGIIEDHLLEPPGFDAADRYDFREWLKRHGASDVAIWSPPITTWYDAAAAYRCGNPRLPSLSAAVSLKAMSLAMLTYKGSFAYQLAAEVGESFVAPVFAALKNRGVKFRFFHRLRDVVPENGEIVRLQVERLVDLKSGDPDSYDPFIYITNQHVKDHRAWPCHPLYDQIATTGVRGASLDSFYTTWRGQMTELQKGRDFDTVVYALPIQTVPFYCSKIVEEQRKWREMVEHVLATETQSLRLYFKPTLEELGWPGPAPIVSGYAQPYNTWEDACQLAEYENWPSDLTPGAVGTVFGALPAPAHPPGPEDHGYPELQSLAAREAALRFCGAEVGSLWPGASDLRNPPGVDWNKLVDPQNREGESRFAFQLSRANVGPSERYTMSEPGCLQYRLPVDQSGYSNLFLAGDWTRNGLDIGCVESAILSGNEAARVVSGVGDPPERKSGPVRLPGEAGPQKTG